MFRYVKSQLASTDLVISGIAIILFASIVVSFLIIVSDDSDAEYEKTILTNIENSEYDFISHYVVDEELLTNFSNRSYYEKIKPEVFSGSNLYNMNSSDVCIFFYNGTRDNFDIIPVNGSDALGEVYDSEDHNSRSQCSVSNPCKYYASSDVYKKILARKKQIVMMYVNICTG